MKTTLALLATLLAATALAACGGDDTDDGAGATTTPGAPAGPGISIDEALESDSAEPLLVNGNLLIVDGQARLCSALAESFPPQCGGASLLVTGLDIAQVDGLMVEGDVMWTDRPTRLAGVVADGILTVSGG
jgi:predicted small secreted protein